MMIGWRRRKPPRTNASNSPDLALAKPGPRSDEQRAEHVAEVAQIRVTREACVRRAGGKCECCGARAVVLEMNEDPSRAKTRGWPIVERFNTRICLMLCRTCHQAFTAGQIRFEKLSDYGFNGAYLAHWPARWASAKRIR